MKSEPVAVTTQEALDESREKMIRIASVEHVELGKEHHGAVNHGPSA